MTHIGGTPKNSHVAPRLPSHYGRVPRCLPGPGHDHPLALQARADRAGRKRLERKARMNEPAGPPDLSWREACAALHEELDRLPDGYRLPLLLCYLEGKSRDEAAAELGWTVNRV